MGLRKQEAGPHGRAEIVGQRIRAIARRPRIAAIAPHAASEADLPVADARPDRAQVAQAEAASEDRRVAQDGPVLAGSRAARRSISVRTADGTSRAAFRPSRHSPSICWRVPASRCVRASSSTMNGTPSDWTCIAAADAASTGPPRTRFEELRRLDGAEPPGPQPPDEAHPLHVGDEVHRLADRRELVRPDGQEQEDRPVGIAPDDVPEQAQGVVVGPLDVVDEQSQRPHPGQRRDGDAREVERPEQLGVRRQALEPGFVAARDGLDHALHRGLGQGAGRRLPEALAANRLRATRNGPRISSSAVIAMQANPFVAASSAAASSSRVLPMPGSPSRVTAASRPDASRSSWAIASSSAVRPMTGPLARRNWTASEHWGPTSGSSGAAVGGPRGPAARSVQRVAHHRADYGGSGVTWQSARR